MTINMRKILITEDEKFRILGMHKNAIKKEFLNEQFAGAGDPTDLDITADPTATTPDATVPTATTSGATTPDATVPDATGALEAGLVSQDKDYEYKKVGDKYYFKLKTNPATPKLQTLVKQGKFTDWSEAKKPEAIAAISKLKFTPMEKMELKPVTKIDATTQTSGTTVGTNTQASGTTVGGGGSPLLGLGGALQQGMQQLQKQFPNIANVDAVTQGKIATWSKSPAGQYILNTPADQREKAMDNLDKMFGGDQLTKELKKPIRQALGMKADNMFGRIGSAVKGGVQGIKQGFNQQM